MILLQSTSTYIISTVNLIFRIEGEQNLFYFCKYTAKKKICLPVSRGPEILKTGLQKMCICTEFPCLYFNRIVFYIAYIVVVLCT